MNRRGLLGGGAALGMAGVAVAASAGIAAQAGATPAAGPDAELIVACEGHASLLADWNTELEVAPDHDKALWDGEGPAGQAYLASRDLISAAVPQTMAGVLAKARAAKAEGVLPNGEDDRVFASDAHAFAWDVVNDLLRLSGSSLVGGAP